MKKGIIVLLIAVLASSFAFAGLSGSAGVRFDAYFGNDAKAFLTSNAKSLDFSFTFTSEKVEVAGDEDVHVEVAASAKFILGDREVSITTDPTNGILIGNTTDATRGIGAVISLDTAKIVGKNWYVSVLGTQDAYDYAKAAALQVHTKKVKDDFGNVYDYEDQAASYKADYNKVPGVTVGFNGFTFSAGADLVKVGDEGIFIASGSIETPEFAFNEDAVKVQAAAEFSRFAIKAGQLEGKDSVVGASAKATVAVQDITVGAAVDMGVEYLGDERGPIQTETEFNVDGRVDFKYNFVDVNVYTYAGKAGLKSTNGTFDKFYLEAKAAFDLNAFELPLKVTATVKNITNAEVRVDGGDPVKAGIMPSIKVEYAKDAITAAASFGYNTENKGWNTLVYGTYAFEKFTAGAGVFVKGDTELTKIAFGAFAESDKLVKGATFGLAYGLDGDGNVYGDGAAACISDSGNYSTNYKADPVQAGEIVAYCKIAF